MPTSRSQATAPYLFLPAMVFCLLFVLYLFNASLSQAEPVQKDTSSSFTNKDLDQYTSKPGETAAAAKEEEQKPLDKPPAKQREHQKNRPATANEKKEQEHWCNSAKKIKKKIAAIKEELNELEAGTSKQDTALAGQPDKKKRSRESHIRETRKKLKKQQTVLAELEDDAHSKNIPAGWLRCQFE